ncbi:hypothetical protein DRW03_16230 [Corallococcus sp. H22C18031201]|uniref:hypothetical protein n=1 Tax=Citreicoccus inhibens TaxID=2849499 RepID=UPI000E749E2C|nr:hypothetical protein [Citreicoccus inhibens]MBU8896829.1 hypothetical protein [Citreicoccus inhibens]RJS21878.1 hypothetical protein DRW03_16230 [Corallococcus sp. H22C18031201]
MSDRLGMSCRVSHSNANSPSSRVLEQRNLLGGMDLMPVLGRGKRKRARQFHVAAERRLGFAAALALVVEHGRQRAKETGTTSLSRCPRCSHVGPTEQDFGFRVIRGEQRPQSWCRGCRGVSVAPSTTSTMSASRTEDGWLFPPETLSTRPPKRGKRSSSLT